MSLMEELRQIVNESPLPRDATPPCMSWPDGWFSPGAGKATAAPFAIVRRLCASCPVQRECLEWAMGFESGERLTNRDGVWGGLTPAERYALDPECPQEATGAA